ncbi:MAG: glycosyltransferase [Candidatus Cloacimonetes bacterium]|nr:glycosyltransferase [Candidatus Cloacimonadota bacterium]
MHKLKVLMVSNLYYPYEIGGAEMSTRRLVNGLFSKGIDITVLSTTSKEKGEERDLVDGIPVIRFFPDNEYWVYEKPQEKWKKAIWHFKELYNSAVGRQIRIYLEELRPDIVHTQNIDSFSPIVWKVAHELGFKVIHTTRDGHLLCPKANFVHQNPQDKYCKSMLCDAYRFWKVSFTKYIDVFCSPSEFLLNEHKNQGLKAKNSVVIADGFDVEKFCELRDSVRERANILYMGHLSEAKGITDLHRAIQKITDMSWVLHIAGKGPLENQIREWTKDPRFVYHGHVSGEAKLDLLKKCSILVMPSRCFENLPGTVIEGLLSGLIVVAPQRGGTTEIMSRFSYGITYDPEHPDGLCLSIHQALNSEDSDFNPREKELDGGIRDWYSETRMLNSYKNVYISQMRII